MGEAKRRKMAAPTTVYHHTSTLRTNLIWMAGVIDLEGRSPPVLHPQLGQLISNPFLRRAFVDFPPLAWFTRRIEIPRCLIASRLMFQKRDGDERVDVEIPEEVMNAINLDRVALGFPISSAPIVPWQNHPGARTDEGKALNDSARAVGDNPSDWYVSDVPVDVAVSTEVWVSRSRLRPKLERQNAYLNDVHRMVRLCRETPGVYIPPTWLSEKEANALAAKVGVPIAKL